MTKAELIRQVESLTASLEKAQASLAKAAAETEAHTKALGKRFFTIRIGGSYDDTKCVAVALTEPEANSIIEQVEDTCSRLHGEGRLLSDNDGYQRWELVVDSLTRFGDQPDLPQFSGYVIRYAYHHEEGTHGHQAWGLLATKLPVAR